MVVGFGFPNFMALNIDIDDGYDTWGAGAVKLVLFIKIINYWEILEQNHRTSSFSRGI